MLLDIIVYSLLAIGIVSWFIQYYDFGGALYAVIKDDFHRSQR